MTNSGDRQFARDMLAASQAIEAAGDAPIEWAPPLQQRGPSPEEVAEDAGREPPLWANASIDFLLSRRDELTQEIRIRQNEKQGIEMELWDRAKADRPQVENAGTMQLAGENAIATIGADRDWQYSEQALMALQTTCACGRLRDDHHKRLDGDLVCAPPNLGAPQPLPATSLYRPILTEEEYGELVTWIPKVDGRAFNSLIRRGGLVERVLLACRSLKSARPTFVVKARS